MCLQEVKLTEYILGKFSDSGQTDVESGETEVSLEDCSLVLISDMAVSGTVLLKFCRIFHIP